MWAETVVFVWASYALMVAAVYGHRYRRFHVPVMAGLMVMDLLVPVYLVLTRDWMKRLIEQEEIFSFMVWMHLILVIMLYVLYIFQLRTARGMLNNDATLRAEHRSQGKALLVTRALVILTSMLLVKPEDGAL